MVWPFECCPRDVEQRSPAHLGFMEGPIYSFEGATLYGGDCVATMKALGPASVDTVLTDPPYGIDMTSRGWDSFGSARGTPPAEAASNRRGEDAFEAWCRDWASACIRVLKPGGHLIAFGSPRKWHRLACAIEDTGFEIRDQIAWLYSTGYPKSRDISVAIDEHYNMIRSDRRTETTGSGATYGRRHRVIDKGTPVTDDAMRWQGWGSGLRPGYEPIIVARKPLDGLLANNVLTHNTGAINIAAATNDRGRWPANVAIDRNLIPLLDTQSGRTAGDSAMIFPTFMFVPKADAAERPKFEQVMHPTVKPLSLMRWLCRVFTPQGGLILDPFAGSGTTLEAALLERFRVIGIERETDYHQLIRIRVTRTQDPRKALAMTEEDPGLFEMLDRP
jgi:DNA modification methylase